MWWSMLLPSSEMAAVSNDWWQGLQDMAMKTGGWGTVCEFTTECTLQMGTIILSSSHKLINQNN